MAQKEVIEIEAKTGKAQKEIEALRKDVQGLAKAQETTAESTNKIASSLGTLTKGVILGVALKAFETLVEVFNKNQKVADFLAVAVESLTIMFNDLINFVLNNTQPIVDTFKKIFNDPQQAIKDFAAAIRDNLIERFNSFIEVLGFAGRAVAALFRGDFSEAADLAKEAGKEMVDVYTGVDNTVDKVKETITKGAEAIKEYTKETYEAASANVELGKQAQIAAAANQGLIEKYDRQAEIQRQIRDDERNSLEDRRKANEELGIILEKQAEEMRKNAQIAVAAAEAELSKNKDNIDAKVALMEANNELAAIEAQIEGFRSEQKANDMALDREAIELINAKKETEIEAFEVRRRAEIEAMASEKDRIEATEILEQQLFNRRVELINQRLAKEKEGSTAYAEILNERAQLEAEYEAESITRNKEQADFNISLKNQEEQSKLAIVGSALSAAQGLAEQGSATYKALASAQVLLDTFKGVQAAFASNAANTGATALSGGAWPFIQAAAAAAFGAANLAGILAVNPKGGNGSVSIPRPSAPSVAQNVSGVNFNTVAAVQQNRLLGDISNAVGQPTRAFVVASDVTTAQELQRKKISNATF